MTSRQQTTPSHTRQARAGRAAAPAALAALAATAGACTPAAKVSDQLATDQIHAWFDVQTATGLSAVASASFSMESFDGPPVLLGADDRIFCNGAELLSVSGGVYAGTVPVSVAAEGTEYRFELVRRARGETAAVAVMEPPAFTLTAVPPSFKIGFPLTLTWTPAGTRAAMAVTVLADCIRRQSVRGLPDLGRALVGPILPAGRNVAQGCRGLVALTRVQDQRPASPFAAARVATVFEESRDVSFDP